MKTKINRKRKKILENELKRITGIVKKEYRPEKVILFGSFSKDEVTETSDIDLLILKKGGERYLDRVDEFLNLVQPKVAMDVFILQPKEIRQKNPYLAEIFEEGKVIYETSK